MRAIKLEGQKKPSLSWVFVLWAADIWQAIIRQKPSTISVQSLL
jgi:hypothetical protein